MIKFILPILFICSAAFADSEVIGGSIQSQGNTGSSSAPTLIKGSANTLNMDVLFQLGSDDNPAGDSNPVDIKVGGATGGSSGNMTIEMGGGDVNTGFITMLNNFGGISLVSGGLIDLHQEGGNTAFNGHVMFSGGVSPVVSACGSAPSGSIDSRSSDHVGRVTIGGGITTSCTLTFNGAWIDSASATLIPVCTVMDETTSLTLKATPTNTALVVTGAFVAGDQLSYHCFGF